MNRCLLGAALAAGCLLHAAVGLAQEEDAWITPPRYSPAEFKRLLEQAEAGDTEAMVKTGESYFQANGVERDLEQSAKWFTLAADKGNARGMGRLADLYQIGAGVDPDLEKALKLYRDGAERGDSLSMAGVGWMVFNGLSVEADVKEAVRWYRKAAEAGGHEGMNNLGFCYHHGHGVERDLAQALAWYRKAAALGNEVALDQLGGMYDAGEGVPRDVAKSRAMYRRAADIGHSPAMFNLAMSYFEPREGEPDYAQALPWLRKAAELEHADAMMALAVAYFTGKGVEKDIKAAADWIQRAAEFGQPQALALVEQSKKAAEERKPLPEPKLAPDSKPAAAPISIMPPADWRKVENAIAVAAFEIGEGDAKATLAVIPLPGEAGGLTANVNRWRSQLALPAADEAAIQKAARSIKVGGVEGRLIDLVGEGADARRILGVIAVRGEQTWFIKLMGPAASVAAQQAAFEAFVTSIKFRE